MSPRHDCSRISLGGAAPRHGGDGKRDILRIEPFGGFYYARRDCGLSVLPAGLTTLLQLARHRSMLELYAENEEKFPQSDEEFAADVVHWREQGFLDDDFKCPAVLVETEPAEGAISAPLVTNIQITQACNLRCAHCYVETMAKPLPNELTLEEIVAVFADLNAMGAPVTVLAGGEPLVRPDLFEILAEAGRYDLDVFLCTNATLIREENARRLVDSPLRGCSISLDGPDAATHDALRGEGQFVRAVRGIQLLIAAGAADVAVRVTVTPHNVDRLAEFAQLTRELGVHKVTIKPFSQAAEASRAPQLNTDRARYLAAVDQLTADWPDDAPLLDCGDGMPTRPPDWSQIIPTFGCVGGNTSCTVTYDAKVVACAAVLAADDWSLREHSFADCWRHAPSIKSWRNLDAGDVCNICELLAQCGGGCRARALGAGATLRDSDPWAYCAV